jgi:hypothetical protein
MAKDFVEFAKEQGLRLDRRGYQRTLGRLFPHDNPYSPAMWRLAIIRDDIDRELCGIGLPSESDDDRVWEHGYFLRQLSVSVLEAKSLIDHDVSKMLKDRPLKNTRHEVVVERVAELRTQLAQAEELLRPIRNGLGGHVRPNRANPEKDTGATESYDVRGLRTHAEWPGTITRNKTSSIGTSYREFTKIAILFVWPEVMDDVSLMKKLAEFTPRVVQTTAMLQAGIDGVLFAFWLEIGAMEPMR